MFFERHGVKQKLNTALQEFAFKSGTNKKVLKLCTVINRKKEEGFKLGDSPADMGFVQNQGLLFMVKSLKAQINAFLISMNYEYLTLMNISNSQILLLLNMW